MDESLRKRNDLLALDGTRMALGWRYLGWHFTIVQMCCKDMERMIEPDRSTWLTIATDRKVHLDLHGAQLAVSADARDLACVFCECVDLDSMTVPVTHGPRTR